MRIVYWLLVGFSFTLSGCSALFGEEGYFRNREDDYLKAASLKPLEVPGHLNSDATGQLYQVPELTQEDVAYAQDTEEFEAPRPEALSATALVERVKIQRLDDDRWILVNVDPAELWPRIRAFLADNNLQVASTDTDLGLMETSWLSFKDDPDRIDRYRIRIDRGVQPDTSEIHVLHMSLDREGATQAQLSQWPASSSSKERETWMVDELAATLAAEELGAAGGTSLIAQNIGGAVKARIVSVDSEPVLELELARSRALATLTHSAQQEGFTIYDSDPASGVFYLGYREPPESPPGWLARLFGAEENPQPPETPYSLAELRDVLPDNLLTMPAQAEAARERAPKAPGHLLIFTEQSDGLYHVRLRTAYGERMSARKTREMLSVLRKNLI
ncbi:outer membrane protein assembly factor BamC [Marinimicrobium sp. C6131]|uniref:outer membrane protein assembly factor BamC n=1 Tax=Marinimicrobium sp. C6131 TaxID=3022676 RepID=UPI00223E4356|nr:outer membrane protein assembly factor BamC [Marinimicrobium sp. C6131]UZJ44782.1 outer membrane protein assembly factor BamC [Marinimicrobium sp. C6131]